MVRVTQVLARVPVIKFPKGGAAGSRPSGPPSAPQPAASASAAPAPVQMQAAAPMSTSSIPDIDLPLRYRRAPLSDVEIEHINGGGIV